jgi:hypothetical protein
MPELSLVLELLIPPGVECEFAGFIDLVEFATGGTWRLFEKCVARLPILAVLVELPTLLVDVELGAFEVLLLGKLFDGLALIPADGFTVIPA